MAAVGRGALASVNIAASIFAAVFLLAAVVGLWRGPRAVKLWIAWIYLTSVDFIPMEYSYALAPRYLYFPAMGMAALFGVLIASVASRGRAQIGAGTEARRAWSVERRAWSVLAIALTVVVLGVNLAFAQLIQSHRLRDGRVRRAMIASAQRELADVPAGVPVRLVGLPEPLADIPSALPLWISAPHRYGLADRVPLVREVRETYLMWDEPTRRFIKVAGEPRARRGPLDDISRTSR